MTAAPIVVPRRSNSAAVLVGTATYTEGLPPMRCVANNITDLHDAITGPAGVVDPARVTRIVDESDPAVILERLDHGAARPLDLLLFYYAGHGVLGAGQHERQQLCLALPHSVDRPDRAARTSLPFDAVLQALGGVRARHRVVILDCCFAGLAVDTAGTADTHVLAATDRVERARFAQGARVTDFTRELVRLLDNGIADGAEHLDLASVYRRLAVVLAAEGLPRPTQCAVNSTGDLAIARNVAHGTARSRSGLLARSRFAQALGRTRQYARTRDLLGEIVADATEVLPAGDPDTVVYRHLYASSVGSAGAPSTATALLDELIAELTATRPNDEPALDRATLSRDFWRTRTVDAGMP
ncbi:caspase family protein [Solihabitans fulvus]|uniref:Caspase family protein n=1 Tax=Solihabitans fulvus TaxID=1892852 RepID=A0A5B2WL06_9PSEU|nr:caspase family protein [Solihabitans fulvus]KAA2251372.1 caspase family protein [Solihabitans fulvus]